MRQFYELATTDVGQHTIRAFNRQWLVQNFMGQVLPGDVGKRVYHVPQGLGPGILQVENSEQRDSRDETQD